MSNEVRCDVCGRPALEDGIHAYCPICVGLPCTECDSDEASWRSGFLLCDRCREEMERAEAEGDIAYERWVEEARVLQADAEATLFDDAEENARRWRAGL